MLRPLSLIPSTAVLIGITLIFSSAGQAKPTVKKSAVPTTQSSEKKAVLHAIGVELGHATSGHIKVSSYKVTKLDIKTDWALANVDPGKHAMLDPFMMLLHKRKGGWAFVTLGTEFHGAGKQFFVPRKLWKGWGL